MCQQRGKQTVGLWEHWLPLANISQARGNDFYYKVVERTQPCHQLLTERIGLKVCQLQHFQEDQAMLLIQRVNCVLGWAHLVLLQRNLLFLETSLNFKPEQEIQAEFISQQRGLFNRLKKSTERLSQFVKQHLKEESILEGNYQRLKENIDVMLGCLGLIK